MTYIKNPIPLIQAAFPLATIDHITYDEHMDKGDYSIIRAASHDGTFAFVVDLLLKTFGPLVNCNSYFKSSPPIKDRELADIKYTIGNLTHTTECLTNTEGQPTGQTDRMSIPVKCEYIYED